MTNDSQRVKEIFLAAAEIHEEAAQDAYLEQACSGDAGLRKRVETLLRSHDVADSFLGAPAVALPGLDGEQPTIDSARPAGLDYEKETEDLGFLAPTTRPDSLGRIGHYEVLQVLGKGGFGIVFRAFDDTLQRVVAIKVMAPVLAATSPARKRFLREARSSAQVRHENVVQVYAVEEQPLPYLAMEFIPGETLQQRLDRTGPLDVVETLRISRQIAEGLAAAHGTDLIHRDIKPGNVLLEGAQHKVKITDFGFARAADDASMTQSGMIAGTPMYMAPEQALGQPLDQRADLFSLGSVMYQMVAGRAPFRANTTVAVLKRVAEDTPRNIREVIPETPQWLCDIITKLHAKKPDERYQSAREVADVLADCEAQLKANAKLQDFSRIPQGRTQPSGLRKWVAAAAVLLLPVIALAVTEFAGVTQLFRQQGKIDPIKAGGDPKPIQVVQQGKPDSEGWVQLFNGKDLTGWKPDLLAPGDWYVEDGAIVGRGDISGLLNESGDYANFHLRAEVKINATGDSGIIIRLPHEGRPDNPPGQPAVTGGYEAQIAVRSNFAVHTGSVLIDVDPARPPLIHKAPLMPHRPDQWFVLEVIAEGNRIQTRVNGKPAADYRDDEHRYSQGRLGLQTWGKKITFVQFRKIEIKKLPPVPIAKQEPLPPTFKNSLGMEFVVVPKGRSWLGGGNGKVGDKEVEIPADFYLGKYEVTQEEWEKARRANPSFYSRKGTGKDAVKDVPDADLKRFPVEAMSWLDCQAFVKALNEREKEAGWVYRLPTQVEWEYACRGGPTADRAASAFDFYLAGPTNELLADQGNFNKVLNRTCKVGSYEPNPLGLFDMHGNVWEWCEDAEKEADGTWLPVFRGGSYLTIVEDCRAGKRVSKWSSHHSYNIGLRLARVPSGAASPEAKTPLATDRFALAFDGHESLVRIPSLKVVEDHALTVETWTVLGRSDAPNNEDLVGNADGTGFLLSIVYGPNKMAFSTCLKTPEKNVFAWEKQPVPRHELIHLAGVYDGKAEIRLYVNGQLQSRTPALGGLKPSSLPLALGSNSDGAGGGSRFLGRMNGVRISKVARYDGDFEPDERWLPDTDTLALYHFDEGAGAVLKDSSGNEHHGEIVAAKWVQADGSPIGSPQHAVPSKPLPSTFKNDIGMEFVIVPKGKSWLGGGKDKLGDKEVKIPADFYLGKYEVTQEEWVKVMGENPSHFSRTGNGMEAVKDIPDDDLNRFPVEYVSWDECQIFVAKLNKLENETGWVYRLPTEMEWEYACRGGPLADKLDTAFDFYFARPTNTLLPEQANACQILDRSCKVGSYLPNRLGLFDMHGNLFEWCEDVKGGADGRAARGGGWFWQNSVPCRAGHSSERSRSERVHTVGLRLARVRSGAASPPAPPPLAVAPFTDADVQRIAALPAVEQVEEVRKELMRRNPGFDGKFEHKIEGGAVTEFKIVTDQVTDISPIRVCNALQMLECTGTWKDGPAGQLADLTPLQGMDLSALTHLNLIQTQMNDAGLARFKGCKQLRHLNLCQTKVTDSGLVHFKDCKDLALLNLGGTQVTDRGLAHFKDCKTLSHIMVGGTKVTDAGLASFKGMPLTVLWISDSNITDLTPLQGMPLEEILLTPKNITKGLDILRGIKSLKTIGISWDQTWPAEEFWERYDKGEFAAAPFTDADVQRIAALPAAEQVEEVRKELMKRNPEFDGTVEHKIDDGVVTEIKVVTDKVTDIAPIRVFNALQVLDLSGSLGEQVNGQFADLTPLKGMNVSNLTRLDLVNTKIDDAGLAYFKDCKNLKNIGLKYTKVTDAGLANFKDCKQLIGIDLGGLKVTDQGLANFKDSKEMADLWLNGTQVTDEGLAYFKDCKNLTILHAGRTQVTDAGLVHLKDCKKLTTLYLGYTKITDTGLLDLTGLDKLTNLSLEKTKVTAKAVEGLPKALPKCKIVWDGGVIDPK